MASRIPQEQPLSYSETSLPLPNVEDLSDCESSDSESLADAKATVTRPVKAFFLGCRKSLLITPRDMEEGRFPRRFSRQNTSSDTLIGDETDSECGKESEKKDNPAVAKRDPHHGLVGSEELPAKKGSKFYRFLRWNYGSVYRRIFCLATVGNVAAIVLLFLQGLWSSSRLSYTTAVTAVSANLLAAMLIRNEHVVNALFLIFGTWPTAFPLSFRRVFAKVYSYGGIHSGCSIAATLWYIVFLILMTADFAGSDVSLLRGYIFLVSYAIVFLLCSIIVFAHPRLRAIMHNWFEGVHRYMGWTAVLLFWAQTMLMAADAAASSQIPFAMALVMSPTFWMLACITLLVAYPWTRLRLRDVEAEVLSDHCVKLNFSYANVHYGQAVRLSDSPLRETHAFAVIPNPVSPTLPDGTPYRTSISSSTRTLIMSEKDSSITSSPPTPTTPTSPFPANKKGFSVLVSNAGDWTSSLIRSPPTKIYTRGAPTYGVLRIAGLFSPVLIMATGSGIGPCLSLFVQKPAHPVRIIWSAPAPAQTYGQGVVDLLYATDPDAVIIDTRKTGRPDLVAIAYRVWESSKWEGPREFALGRKGKPLGQCEAVVVISNQKVTKKVVYGLESRGVPAYGAIFDS